MKKLNAWFEIDEKEYLMYILHGYEFEIASLYVCWLLDGKYHRRDGPAIIDNNGTQEWWINGKLHREDGPAYIHVDGHKMWYINGKLHREDGPARIWPNGRKWWYINGIRYTETEFNEKTKQLV